MSKEKFIHLSHFKWVKISSVYHSHSKKRKELFIHLSHTKWAKNTSVYLSKQLFSCFQSLEMCEELCLEMCKNSPVCHSYCKWVKEFFQEFTDLIQKELSKESRCLKCYCHWFLLQFYLYMFSTIPMRMPTLSGSFPSLIIQPWREFSLTVMWQKKNKIRI